MTARLRGGAAAALGQQPDGRGSDDAGSTGDDGHPAIEANSIGHVSGVSSRSSGLSRILVGFAQWARQRERLFHLWAGLTSRDGVAGSRARRGGAANRPFSAVQAGIQLREQDQVIACLLVVPQL
jgi:hypothetical protein